MDMSTCGVGVLWVRTYAWGVADGPVRGAFAFGNGVRGTTYLFCVPLGHARDSLSMSIV